MDITNLLMLLGGLGLFLYGMKIMGEGLELAAGSRLRNLLEKLTKNKYLGALVGLIVTAVIQSSSATTVMVVGFVNAGLMNLSQAAGVIMGANIGTTVTSALIALKVDAIAPIAIFIGVSLMTFTKKNNTKHIGQIIAGLGILFMGMTTMSSAMAPLKNVEWFINLMAMFQNNPLLGVLAGMVLTAIIQSSSASVGILQALASQGLISLGGSAFILYGQNIGTCITAMISSIGTGKSAKKAAVVHLLFNVIGTFLFVVITLMFRDALIGSIESLFPITALSADQMAMPAFADAVANNQRMALAQISMLHMIFNIGTTLLLLPMSNLLVKLANIIVPGEDKKQESMTLKYLDKRILNTPPIAVAQVLKEIERMAMIARENCELSVKALLEKDSAKFSEDAKTVLNNEKVVNYLNHSITEYLVQINALELEDHDSQVIGALFHVVNDIERVSDHCENLIEVGQALETCNTPLSQSAHEELQIMHEKICAVIDSAIYAFTNQITDLDILQKITDLEEDIDDKTEEFRNNHIERLNSKSCTARTGVLYADALTNLERISDHAANIAYALATED